MTDPAKIDIAALEKSPEWVEVHSADEMQAFFRSRLPAIREAAKACGYAIGVHGSERRDFDLIAVPWIDAPSTPDELAAAIMMAACGMTIAAHRWEPKPHGRIAVSLPICWPEGFADGALSLGMIDLSVMLSVTRPTIERAARAKALDEAAERYTAGLMGDEWDVFDKARDAILALKDRA